MTGGLGFIGSHIVDPLMNVGARVRVLDDKSTGDLRNCEQWIGNNRFELLVADIRDGDAVRQSLKEVSLVFHEAAKVSVPLSVEDPLLVMDTNVMGTAIILDECRKADIEKVVVASSCAVYGDTLTLPTVETMSPGPISPYAVSKLAAENLTMSFCSTYGLNTTALRYFNVYGPRLRSGS